MYSFILMTAMAQSPSTADFNGYFRDRWLGNGCSGTTAAASCSGCSGSTSCSGCSCQGGLFSGDRVRSLFGSNCSGCCGSSCSGIVNYGCCSSVAMSCMGSYSFDMPMAYGGCFGNGMPMMPSGQPGVPQLIPPTGLPMGGDSPYAQPQPVPSEYGQNLLPPPSLTASPNRATVIVKLPADARLFAEGKPLNLTSAERSFVTPELPAGREYSYTFRMEVERQGRTVGESRTVSVVPGKVSTVEFAEVAKADPVPVPKLMPETVKPAMATSLPKSEPAGERARITVKVPAGATLFVNEGKQSSNEFRTPPLPTGREFTYTMKIEVTKNGFPEQVSQKVTFKAGDSLTVDFTDSRVGLQ